VTEAEAREILRRHRRAWWRVLTGLACRRCGAHWPCEARLTARQQLMPYPRLQLEAYWRDHFGPGVWR
jgi:hypothetical protein